ncbi:MAG: cytochrome c [Planctomycetia bacterium]|nr:cytochrome c [Planctomycetia bacterium]
MSLHLRSGVILGVCAALGIGSLTLSERSVLAQGKGGLTEAIGKISAAVDKGDLEGAKKLAAETAKNSEWDEVMHLFVLRSHKKPGLGVGDKAGAITPDGIEKKLMKLAENPLSDKDLGAESAALVKMGNDMVALTLVTLAKPPEKDDGKKKKKDWVAWSEEMLKASQEFTAAAKAKKAADLQKAAVKADKSCGKCHDVFRFE